MKNIYKILTILFFIFLLSCCFNNNVKTNVSSIECDFSLLPKEINTDNLDISLIKLFITYKDGNSKEDYLKESMLNTEDVSKLQSSGNHKIHFTYENFKSSFSITILESKYSVVFYDIDDNVINEQFVAKGQDAQLPTYPEIEGFIFEGLSSNDYLNVTSDIEIRPIYSLVNPEEELNKVYQYLFNKYNNSEVNTNLDLESKVNHINVEWESFNNYLSSDGSFDRPYQATILNMRVNIYYGDESLSKNITMKSDGYKNIESNIASGYVYRNFYSLDDQFFETMDIIYCAFIMFNSDGTLQDNGYVLASVRNRIIEKANEEGTYVVMSLGGGGSEPSRAFSDMCKNPTARKTLIDNIIYLINEYGFDGVDIDWETPSYSERANFTTFTKELYEAVKDNNPHHLVTAAIGGGKWQPPSYDLPNSQKYLDFINVMTYSMSSSSGYYQNALYSSKSYHNSTLKVGRTLDSCSIEESIKMYNSLSVDNSKLIFGLAFYGIAQSNSTGRWVKSQNLDYSVIVNKYLNNDEYTYVYDENAQVPYLIKKDGTIFISYDDPRSIKAKADYMREMGCAGLMYWENGCDSTGELVKAMQEALK